MVSLKISTSISSKYTTTISRYVCNWIKNRITKRTVNINTFIVIGRNKVCKIYKNEINWCQSLQSEVSYFSRMQPNNLVILTSQWNHKGKTHTHTQCIIWQLINQMRLDIYLNFWWFQYLEIGKKHKQIELKMNLHGITDELSAPRAVKRPQIQSIQKQQTMLVSGPKTWNPSDSLMFQMTEIQPLLINLSNTHFLNLKPRKEESTSAKLAFLFLSTHHFRWTEKLNLSPEQF